MHAAPRSNFDLGRSGHCKISISFTSRKRTATLLSGSPPSMGRSELKHLLSTNAHPVRRRASQVTVRRGLCRCFELPPYAQRSKATHLYLGGSGRHGFMRIDICRDSSTIFGHGTVVPDAQAIGEGWLSGLTATCRIVHLVTSESEFDSHNGDRQVHGKAAGLVL